MNKITAYYSYKGQHNNPKHDKTTIQNNTTTDEHDKTKTIQNKTSIDNEQYNNTKQDKTNNTNVSNQQEQLNQNSKFKQNYKISSNCDALEPLDKTNKTKITKLSSKTRLDKQALGEGHACDVSTENEINVATKLVTPITINRMKHDDEQAQFAQILI